MKYKFCSELLSSLAKRNFSYSFEKYAALYLGVGYAMQVHTVVLEREKIRKNV